VKVGTADTTVGNLDIDIVLALTESVAFVWESNQSMSLLTPLLGLEFSPLHVALDGLGIMAEPAFEFVVGTRHFVDGVIDVGCSGVV
jgi:hypothetical protein